MKTQNKKPPKFTEWLLRVIANKNNNSAIIGDLEKKLAGISALAIALLTVSFQAIKAAATNPVNSLKYE